MKNTAPLVIVLLVMLALALSGCTSSYQKPTDDTKKQVEEKAPIKTTEPTGQAVETERIQDIFNLLEQELLSTPDITEQELEAQLVQGN